jgi:hypothetical protein
MLILLPNCKKQTNTNSPKEKIKQSADNEDFDPERCQASSKGDLFSNFKSGCLGKYCYEKECGDIAMKFRENKTFYAEYSCHGPAYTGKWRIRDNILEATAFSTETQDDYCVDQCEGEEPACLKSCKSSFYSKFGRKVLKTRLVYTFVDKGAGRIEMQLATTDLNYVDGKEKYDNSAYEPEWENMGCMHY